MNLDAILKILGLINAAIPLGASVWMTIKKPDGTETTIELLESSKAKFRENISEAEEFLARAE